MEQIFPNMKYKVMATTAFMDGGMPEGFRIFKKNEIREGIPGSVLVRLMRSDPNCFELLGRQVLPEPEKEEPKAKKEKPKDDKETTEG